MKRKRCGAPQPTLPFEDDERGPIDAPATGRYRSVTIQRDAQGDGYIIVDATRRRVFGSVLFASPEDAEAYLHQANRRSTWVRWKLKQMRRKRRRRSTASRGKQLKLF